MAVLQNISYGQQLSATETAEQGVGGQIQDILNSSLSEGTKKDLINKIKDKGIESIHRCIRIC